MATQAGMKSVTVSLPPELYAEVEAIARDEHRSRSEVIREALRQYQFTRRWRLVRQWGAETAIRLKLEDDDEALEQALG